MKPLRDIARSAIAAIGWTLALAKTSSHELPPGLVGALFRVTSIDHAPEDLYAQVPFSVTLLRKIGGPDRPDYWLAECAAPLQWLDAGSTRTVRYVVLAARYVGDTIHSGSKRIIVGIALVIDDTLIEDASLSFEKSRYVAIGVLEGAGNGAAITRSDA